MPTPAIFRAAATTDVGVAANVWPVNMPAGVASGDLLLVGIVGQTTTPVMVAPTGWTIVDATRTSPTSDSRGYVFRRVADGSEGATVNFTWSAAATQSGVAGAVAYRNIDTTTPINSAAGGNFASTTTPAGPALTPTVDNCVVLSVFGTDMPAASVSWTPASGYTERVDAQDTGPFCTIHIAEKTQTTAGAETPTPTVTNTDEGVAWTIALSPAPDVVIPPPTIGRSFGIVIA